jgi:hypothetical protein
MHYKYFYFSFFLELIDNFFVDMDYETAFRLNVVIETSVLYDSFSEKIVKKCDNYDAHPERNLGSQ